MKRVYKGFLPVLLIFSIFGCTAMSPRISPDTGRIRILLMGEPFGKQYGPYQILKGDPLFETTPVIAFSYYWPKEVIQKSVRVNMPRIYGQLTDEYDVISLQFAETDSIPTGMKPWFNKAVKEDGLGLFFLGVRWSYSEWLTMTTLSDVVPVDTVPVSDNAYSYSRSKVGIRIIKPEHPLISSVPWSEVGRYGFLPLYNVVKSKEGSEVLANVVPILRPESSFLVWWDFGNGRTLTQTASHDDRDIEFTRWEYHSDWVSNIHIFLAGQEIPQNYLLRHELKRKLWNCGLERGIIISTVEFVSSLGGNSLLIEQSLVDIDHKIREAEGLYLERDYEGGMALVEEAMVEFKVITNDAMELKDRTFMWIYIIEWLILISTSMVTGTLVWGLMVRRLLYREVKTTSLSRIVA
jgi:hypothetical protein